MDVLPSASGDEYGTSVGGATSPENVYYIDGLNTMLTFGHYWTDYIRGTSTNRARADAAWIQAFGSDGAAFDTTWGKKNFNQVFLNAFPQLFFRQR